MTPGIEPTITLTREDEWWVARDTETGVASQGQTRQAALENLDEAVEGFQGDGTEPTREELIEAGIDPAKNVSGKSLSEYRLTNGAVKIF